MKYVYTLIIAISCMASACGTQKAESKSTDPAKTTASTAGGEASAVVRKVYDDALKGNCSSIPANLTAEFREAVGTSDDALQALCDTFTDSKKITSVEVIGENVSGDDGKVQVALKHKDGKVEQREEVVKKLQGKWVMDS